MTKRRVSRREAIATGLAGAGAGAAGWLGAGCGPSEPGSNESGSLEPGSPEPGSPEAPAGAAESGAGRGVHAAVVGAGAFGGWTALQLRRQGARVTLLDAWGPGNSRASSGGETRVIRATYGPYRIYTEMVLRALELWKAHERAFGERLFFRTGAVWMSAGEDRYAKDAVPILRELGVAFEEWNGEQLARRFPRINPEGIAYALHEEGAGYLLARRGCQAVLDGFLAAGGEYRQAEAAAGAISGGRMRELRLADGERVEADLFVFAGGPWLSHLFPGFDPPLVQPTRQEILYFGAPPGRPDLTDRELPVWVETGEHLFYGIPGSNYRGFKVADDARGAPFDPTGGDRTPSPEAIRAARAYMEHRFPALRGAPLVEARVCQYEQSADGHLIVDTHPEAANVWIAGGGSGHGYKLGPALGEMLAGQALGTREKEPFFGLARFEQDRSGENESDEDRQ